jgi:hypothetical protein
LKEVVVLLSEVGRMLVVLGTDDSQSAVG